MNGAYFGAATDVNVNAYPSLVYAEAQAITNTTTTNTNFGVLNSMTITPIQGVYLVLFSSSCTNSANGQDNYFSIFSDGIQVTQSERKLTPYINGIVVGNAPLDLSVACMGLVSVNGFQAIDIRWRVTGGTGTCYQRSMAIIKFAST